MSAGLLRPLASASIVLGLSAAIVWGQDVHFIKLTRHEEPTPAPAGAVKPVSSPKIYPIPPTLPFRLLTPDTPPLPPPTVDPPPPAPPVVITEPPPNPPPRFDPPRPPIYAPSRPPAHLNLPAGSPFPPGYQGPGTAPILPALPPPESAGLWPEHGRIWARAEALLWWVRSQPLPPLLTSSLPGTPRDLAGALGSFGTSTIIGSEGINSDPRFGARFVAGAWFDDCHTCGLMLDYFFLARDTASLAGAFDGASPLARPIVDILNGRPAGELVGFPGELTGRVGVTGSTSAIEGASALLREHLCTARDECGDAFWRLDLLGGYRYFRLSEGLQIREDLIVTRANDTAVGTQIVLTDVFQTRNAFHGFDLGLINEFRFNSCWLELTTKIAAGYMDQRVGIFGNTTTTVPTGNRTSAQGGLLALVSNIGTYRRTRATVLPELGVNLGWQVTPSLRVFTGYQVLFLEDVVRPGDQIDLGVNTNLLPPTTRGGPERPAFAFRSSDMWLQGAKLGVELRY